jgi:hypothetical protein
MYCVSPLIYPIVVSLYFGTPIGTVAKETLDSNSLLRNFETFLLPIVLGLFTFFARRVSYFIVVIGSIYLVARNFFLFAETNDSVPMSGLVGTNLIFVFVIVYLSRKNTRAIYFNSKLRWWETDPRYVVGWAAMLSRLGKVSTPIKIRNIAVGGAAIETDQSGFIPHELVNVEFQNDGKSYKLAAGVVWEQNPTGPQNLLGLQWVLDQENNALPAIRELIQALKSKNVPTTRPSDWWHDFKSWVFRPDT